MGENEQMSNERITILVVHGIGEQGRFEHLESTAANLYKALVNNSRKPRIEMRPVNHATRGSLEQSLDVAPTLINWRAENGGQIKASFREVHWADLDMPYTYCNWIKLVGWSLSVAGARFFARARVGPPEAHAMCPPATISWYARLKVRLQLFGVSLLFLMLLGTVSLLNGLLERLSIKLPPLQKIGNLIFNYLGDVKLYQDWFKRDDERIEVLDEQSRVAIRRRMIRELIAIAAKVERREIDGYYVLAHSLGTVVAFNALMETALSLPNYLSQEEWNALPGSLKKSQNRYLPENMMPSRPIWLDNGASWEVMAERDMLDRARLFSGLRGVLTMGSPLNKFAALWPAIVPVNSEELPHKVDWINVQDVQDIVAGATNLFEPCPGKNTVGGLVREDMLWSDQRTLFTAHTSYWKADGKTRDRLIDRLIPWLEGGTFEPPQNRRNVWLSRAYFYVALALLSLLLLGTFTLLFWVLKRVYDNVLVWDDFFISFCREALPWMGFFLALGAGIVLFCAIARGLWEKWRFR